MDPKVCNVNEPSRVYGSKFSEGSIKVTHVES